MRCNTFNLDAVSLKFGHDAPLAVIKYGIDPLRFTVELLSEFVVENLESYDSEWGERVRAIAMIQGELASGIERALKRIADEIDRNVQPE